MKPGIFTEGTFIDSPEGVNMAGTGKKVGWVAVRGGIHDWSIYAENPYTGIGYPNGDKVTGEANIKKLVPCDDEAFKMYRY